jgi:hypothetical protein
MRQTAGNYAKSWMVAHRVLLLNTPGLSQPSFNGSERSHDLPGTWRVTERSWRVAE